MTTNNNNAITLTAALARAAMPKLELRKLKLAGGEETRRFEAELWINGVRAAHVANGGTGGCNDWHDYDAASMAALRALCAQLPPINIGNGGFPDQSDLIVTTEIEDLIVGMLIDRAEIEKKIRRAVKTKTVFKVKGQAANEYFELRAPFDVKVKAHLIAKYGDRLEVIYNEQVGA